jgi:eukaryotic-like serine/threonine-protein kinase
VNHTWSDVDALFARLLDVPPDQREAELQKARARDPELYEAARGLLDTAERMGAFLTDPVAVIPGDFWEELGVGAPDRSGERIGAYRIIRPLGRGGMSTVYLAERADGQFDQRVALKVLRSDLRSDELAARIRTERQILASLDHPNIARVFDGGVTDDGRPYLVIEVVTGQPIDRHADADTLSVQERLALFAQVGEAVQYAHRNLVVHRDLKPSNVLVTDQGRVKLLDFGIAKLLDRSDPPEPETRPATRWMTPEYAAPEQILGKSVTTSTDVYALGLILYELLSGHRPFGDARSSGYVLEKAICEDLPARPSVAAGHTAERETAAGTTRVTPEDVARARSSVPGRLQRTLDGDLDAVVLRCLRKEPEARYDSVGALLDDLTRYGEGFPVRAREGARAYRARKFVRRHRIGVAWVSAAVVALAGGTLLLSVQQAATARERDRANEAAAEAAREAENAQLVTAFLADVFRGDDPAVSPGDTVTARELLAWGMERVDSEFADRPAVQAELLSVMGRAHFNLGLLDEAIVLHERSLKIRREIYGERAEKQVGALSDLANAYRNNRDPEAALPLTREALEIQRATPEADDDGLADALTALGRVLRDLGRPDTAEVLIREALAIHVRTSGQESEAYVRGLLSLAFVLRTQDKLDEAEALYRVAIPRYRAMAGERDTELPIYLNNLAYLLRVKEDYAGAAPLYQEALAILTEVFGRGHPNALLVANNLAGSLVNLGRYTEADALLSENLSVARTQWPDGHPRVGSPHLALGRLRLWNNPAAAEREFREAARIFSAAWGPDDRWSREARANLALSWILTGREAEGQPVLDAHYEWLAASTEPETGRLPRPLAASLEGTIRAMTHAGLVDEARRFGELMPEGWPN